MGVVEGLALLQEWAFKTSSEDLPSGTSLIVPWLRLHAPVMHGDQV